MNSTPSKTETSGRCRVCGCTDDDCSQCVARTGKPCHWTNATATLCSACVVPTLDQVIGLSEIKAITVLRGTEFKAALDKLRGCSMGKRSLVMGLNDAAAITLAIRIALADCTICTGDLRNDLVRILREITESLTVLTAVERAALRGERQTE